MFRRQLVPFGDLFLARLQELEESAKEVGLNMTAICKEAGISRASPDRWRKELPRTVQIMQELEEIVARAQAEYESETKEMRAKLKRRPK